MYYLKNVNFTVPHTAEEIYFDQGEVAGYYDIINWQFNDDGELSYVHVGNYTGKDPSTGKMEIWNSSIVWNNGQFEVGLLEWHKDVFDVRRVGLYHVCDWFEDRCVYLVCVGVHVFGYENSSFFLSHLMLICPRDSMGPSHWCVCLYGSHSVCVSVRGGF